MRLCYNSHIHNYFKTKEQQKMNDAQYPFIKHCYFCGKETKAEISYPEAQDYKPCEDCQTKMKNNIILIAVAKTPLYHLQPPIAESNQYPTGRYAILTKDMINKLIIPNALKDYLIKHNRVLIDNNTLTELLSFDISIISESPITRGPTDKDPKGRILHVQNIP